MTIDLLHIYNSIEGIKTIHVAVFLTGSINKETEHMVLFLLNFVSAVKCFIFEFLYKMNHFKLVHDTCLVNCAISMSMFT